MSWTSRHTVPDRGHVARSRGLTLGQRHIRRSRQDLSGRHHGGARPAARDRGRRVHGARRPVGLRQDDGAADGRRPRGDHRGRAAHRRARRQPRAVARPRHRDGVPELRALPAPHASTRTSRSGCRLKKMPKEEIDRRVQEAARVLGLEPFLEAQAARALGRPAPARRDGPRDRARAAGVPDGRAALEPRREAARADARRDQPPAARPRRRRRSTSRTTRSRR